MIIQDFQRQTTSNETFAKKNEELNEFKTDQAASTSDRQISSFASKLQMWRLGVNSLTPLSRHSSSLLSEESFQITSQTTVISMTERSIQCCSTCWFQLYCRGPGQWNDIFTPRLMFTAWTLNSLQSLWRPLMGWMRGNSVSFLPLLISVICAFLLLDSWKQSTDLSSTSNLTWERQQQAHNPVFKNVWA